MKEDREALKSTIDQLQQEADMFNVEKQAMQYMMNSLIDENQQLRVRLADSEAELLSWSGNSVPSTTTVRYDYNQLLGFQGVSRPPSTVPISTQHAFNVLGN